MILIRNESFIGKRMDGWWEAINSKLLRHNMIVINKAYCNEIVESGLPFS